ncbi:hypothetical protein BKA61DRAFT_248909 [Leptodontidium sp. MPI-SDFR-AT-0119]|nr:hypothetical protein BKA61DRAFT_248909 [Leptodontidium sp. MPI-SDFR-AT-0119]
MPLDRPVGGKERARDRSSCKFPGPFYGECYGRGLFHGDGDDHGDVVKSGSEFPRHITSVSERCLASTCRQPCHRGPSPSPSPSQSTAVMSCHLPLPFVQANFHSSKGMFIVSIEHSRLDLSAWLTSPHLGLPLHTDINMDIQVHKPPPSRTVPKSSTETKTPNIQLKVSNQTKPNQQHTYTPRDRRPEATLIKSRPVQGKSPREGKKPR